MSAAPSAEDAPALGVPAAVPVLEIGGTHVTAARVDLRNADIVQRVRHPLDAHSDAQAILDAFAAAAISLQVPEPVTWGIAIPGPFDYQRGVGDFRGVDKFLALCGVDVGRALRTALPAQLKNAIFLNDGEAFAIGEWRLGGYQRGRCVVLTLGTGVGSSYLVNGRPAYAGAGVPTLGQVFRLTSGGRPLEHTVSRAAMIAAYSAAAGERADVHVIAERARAGDAVARAVFERTFAALGEALAPSLVDFGADILLVGGSIAQSWDLIEPPLRRALAPALSAPGCTIAPAPDAERAALVGAAIAAAQCR